jgi:hypothetical protein
MRTARRCSLSLRRCALGLAVAGCAHAAPAAADTPDAAHPFSYEVRAQAAMNPGSLYLQPSVIYRRFLYDAQAPLLAHNEWALQVGLGLSPASLRPSIRLTVQPLSILRLWIAYEGEGYFGISGFARSFPSPSSNYGRGPFSPPPDGPAGSTGAYSLWVNRFELGVRPQVQLGPWLARSSWRAVRYEANLRGGDRVLYDPWIDDVVYAHGWAVQSDTDLAYELSPDGASDGGPLVGVRFSLNLVFYPSDAYAPGEAQNDSNSPSARVGPWVRWPLLTPDRARAVHELFVTGLTQFYVADRFHTGTSTPAAIPMVSLSLTATGDL